LILCLSDIDTDVNNINADINNIDTKAQNTPNLTKNVDAASCRIAENRFEHELSYKN
jgi:hypothetical protein